MEQCLSMCVCLQWFHRDELEDSFGTLHVTEGHCVGKDCSCRVLLWDSTAAGDYLAEWQQIFNAEEVIVSSITQSFTTKRTQTGHVLYLTTSHVSNDISQFNNSHLDMSKGELPISDQTLSWAKCCAHYRSSALLRCLDCDIHCVHGATSHSITSLFSIDTTKQLIKSISWLSSRRNG